jgi:hypothetical protein
MNTKLAYTLLSFFLTGGITLCGGATTKQDKEAGPYIPSTMQEILAEQIMTGDEGIGDAYVPEKPSFKSKITPPQLNHVKKEFSDKERVEEFKKGEFYFVDAMERVLGEESRAGKPDNLEEFAKRLEDRGGTNKPSSNPASLDLLTVGGLSTTD